MYDHLSNFSLGKEEREKLLMTILGRIRSNGKEPLWLHKRRTESTWNRIAKLYGKDCAWKTIQYLQQLKLIESQGEHKPFIITERGKEYYKRGWIENKINKFDNPKYPLFISIAALIVSVLSSDYFWKAIHFIYQAISRALIAH